MWSGVGIAQLKAKVHCRLHCYTVLRIEDEHHARHKGPASPSKVLRFRGQMTLYWFQLSHKLFGL